MDILPSSSLTPYPPRPDYLAYLVRMWQSNETAAWRASAQDPHTGEQFRFETIEELIVFLRSRTGTPEIEKGAPNRDAPVA